MFLVPDQMCLRHFKGQSWGFGCRPGVARSAVTLQMVGLRNANSPTRTSIFTDPPPPQGRVVWNCVAGCINPHYPRDHVGVAEQVHMGSEYVSREKKLPMVNFFIFVQKNVSRIRFQEIKIRPLKGFEKMRFLCFYIIGV